MAAHPDSESHLRPLNTKIHSAVDAFVCRSELLSRKVPRILLAAGRLVEGIARTSRCRQRTIAIDQAKGQVMAAVISLRKSSFYPSGLTDDDL